MKRKKNNNNKTAKQRKYLMLNDDMIYKGNVDRGNRKSVKVRANSSHIP